MTATTWTGLYRFTLPSTTQAHILLDTDRTGGTIEIVDTTYAGQVALDLTFRGERGERQQDHCQ